MKRLYLLTIAAMLIALLVWLLWPYNIRAYQGDGTISDSGFWSYPRYRVELAKISFSETGAYRFRLAGLPSEDTTLKLILVDKTDSDRALLTKLKTNISASITDDQNRIVCSVSGYPSDGISEDAWILTSSHTSAALYHRGCVDVKLSHSRIYTLKLQVNLIDPSTPNIYVVPIVTSGGNELP